MNQTDSRLNPEWAVIPDLQTKYAPLQDHLVPRPSFLTLLYLTHVDFAIPFRPVLLQIEYGSGKEKSYASPVLGFLDNAKDGPPIMVAKLQLMQPQTRYLFQEYGEEVDFHSLHGSLATADGTLLQSPKWKCV